MWTFFNPAAIVQVTVVKIWTADITFWTGDIGLKWFGTLPSTGVSLFIFLTTEYNFDQGHIVWIFSITLTVTTFLESTVEI